MELSNAVDIISSTIILISILLSYSRGFLRECFTILAWVFSAILSVKIGPSLVPIMVNVSFLEEFFLGNCSLTMLIAFVLTFVISLTIFSLIIPLISPKFSSDKESSVLVTLDRMGGVLFGFVRSIIILIFLLICIQDILPSSYLTENIHKNIEESQSNKLLHQSKIFIRDGISKNASIWLSDTYELILQNKCEKPA